MSSLAIFSSSGKKPPISRTLLSRLKNAVLGRRYELSVAFINPKEMQRLNRRYRGTDEPTDILAFPLGSALGELLLCPDEAARRAPRFERNPRDYLRLLVIHGLLHLKGMTHGRRMEREERKFRAQFGI